MPIKEFLLPEEEVKYSSTEEVEYEGAACNLFITDKRIILFARKGLPFLKKKRFGSEKLPEIKNMYYEEEGQLRTKGILTLETPSKKISIKGTRDNVKAVMKELQKFLTAPEKKEEAPLVKEVKETEVITREVVMIHCAYCKGLMPQTSTFCPNCGARRMG